MNKSNPILTQKRAVSQQPLEEIIAKSASAGVSGAAAMALHVACLMWMRTIMNYQYKNGGGFGETFKHLYHQGNIARFYRGVIPALAIGPLFRFGDVASNMFAMSLSKQYSDIGKLPIYLQTSIGSVLAGFWRLAFIPIDAWKTSKQVNGKDGLQMLMTKSKTHGVSAFYQGGVAEVLATTASHYSWFLVHNYLEEYLPQYNYRDQFSNAVIRSGVIGFLSTLFADCVSNSMRVAKTFKQTSQEKLSYGQVFSQVIQKDGVSGILLRGLFTKIMINSVQGISFSISWKLLDHRLSKSTQKKQ